MRARLARLHVKKGDTLSEIASSLWLGEQVSVSSRQKPMLSDPEDLSRPDPRIPRLSEPLAAPGSP